MRITPIQNARARTMSALPLGMNEVGHLSTADTAEPGSSPECPCLKE